MADQYCQIIPDQSGGKKVDVTELTVGANTVERERINITDPATAAGIATVDNASPANTEYGLSVRIVRSIQSPAAPATVSVAASSGSAVAANASRSGLVIVNLSANIVSFGLGATAVLNNGISLMPNGGVWVMDAYTFTTSAVNAIAAVASSTISVQEFS